MPSLLRPILAGIAALVVLVTLAQIFTQPLGLLMQHPIAWTMEILFPDFDVIDMRIADQRGEMVYEVTLQPQRMFMVGLNLISDPRYLESSISASTPMTRWFQQVILALTLVLAWPGLPLKRRVLALLLAVVLIPLIVLADSPFVLAGALDDMLRAAFAPDTLDDSWLRQWMHFMDGGGRLALGVGAGLAALAATGGLQSERSLFFR